MALSPGFAGVWLAPTPSRPGDTRMWITSTRWGLSMATNGDFHMATDTGASQALCDLIRREWALFVLPLRDRLTAGLETQPV